MFFYFVPFMIGCGLLLLAAIFRPRLIYEYPYFMTATFAAFIAPQLYGLYLTDSTGSYGNAVALMSLLSLAACFVGYLLKAHPALIEKVNVSLNMSRFLHGGILLV